jgi:hypothetical protein
LTFLAQDAGSDIFCYSNADIRKGEEADEIFRFTKFWTRQHGSPPQHLVFDSKLTTYEGLDRLDEQGIIFITLRRRSAFLLKEIANLPASAWRTSYSMCCTASIAHPASTSRKRAPASAPSRSRRAYHPAHQ